MHSFKFMGTSLSHFMDVNELQQVQLYTLWRFAKTSKRFIYPLGYLWVAHWAKTNCGLSTGRYAILPEGEGKGKVSTASVKQLTDA